MGKLLTSLGRVSTRILGRIEESTLTITGIFFGFITILMLFEVVARYIFRSPFMYAEPFIMVMLGWTVFLLIGEIARKDEHIRIGFFATRILGKRSKDIVYALESVVCMALSIYMGYWGIMWVKLGIKLEITQTITPTGGTYPGWIPGLIVPIGFFLAAVFYFERIVKQAVALKQKSSHHVLPSGGGGDIDAF